MTPLGRGPRLQRIGWQDRGLHEAVFRFVDRVFPGADFRTWHARGGWGAWYTAWSLLDDGEIVANVCVSGMQLVTDGRPRAGWQLGAVGVVPERRGEGLMRPLMSAILTAAGAEPATRRPLVFLFANDSVRDFYPRFGFEHVREAVFGVHHAAAPAPGPCRRLDLACEHDRALVAELSASAAAASDRLAARDYFGILLWHACNDPALAFFHVPDRAAVVVVRDEGPTLTVADVLAPRPFELAAVLPRLLAHPIEDVEFGFVPGAWWPAARAVREDTDSPLFVSEPLGRVLPCKFPVLAQT